MIKLYFADIGGVDVNPRKVPSKGDTYFNIPKNDHFVLCIGVEWRIR